MIDWNRIDIVLLDMDGTLLDLHYDNTVWNNRLPIHYAQRHGMSTDDANTHLVSYMRQVYGTIRFYCLEHWADFTGLDIMAPHRDAVELIGWRPNALEFLRRTRARAVPAVLATNAHRLSVDIKDAHSNITQELDAVYSAHDFGEPKEAQAFWAALREAHPFDPERALFIDDNAGVLEAARTFGIGQLLAISQPDSARPPRHDFDFPVLNDFSEIFPPDA